MFKVGITERGDAGLDFSWEEKLDKMGFSILITKSINDTFINKVIAAYNKGHKIIVHVTCTGFGATVIEPNVKNYKWTKKQLNKLIEKGFPIKNIVLRIDPIIPTEKGIKNVLWLLYEFKDTSVKRVRYSFLDLYPHVKKRFKKANIALPTITENMKLKCLKKFEIYEKYYEFEACAENTKHKLGCVSYKDFDILEISRDLISSKRKNQRTTCLCVSNKTELLSSKHKCSHGCLYCYWND